MGARHPLAAGHPGPSRYSLVKWSKRDAGHWSFGARPACTPRPATKVRPSITIVHRCLSERWTRAGINALTAHHSYGTLSRSATAFRLRPFSGVEIHCGTLFWAMRARHLLVASACARRTRQPFRPIAPPPLWAMTTCGRKTCRGLRALYRHIKSHEPTRYARPRGPECIRAGRTASCRCQLPCRHPCPRDGGQPPWRWTLWPGASPGAPRGRSMGCSVRDAPPDRSVETRRLGLFCFKSLIEAGAIDSAQPASPNRRTSANGRG